MEGLDLIPGRFDRCDLDRTNQKPLGGVFLVNGARPRSTTTFWLYGPKRSEANEVNRPPMGLGTVYKMDLDTMRVFKTALFYMRDLTQDTCKPIWYEYSRAYCPASLLLCPTCLGSGVWVCVAPSAIVRVRCFG